MTDDNISRAAVEAAIRSHIREGTSFDTVFTDDLITAIRSLPPAPVEGDGLRERNAELCSLAHGWMVAHDRLKAGEPYELPKPVPPGEIERLRDALLRRLWEDCPSERQEHCELDPSGCKCRARAALSQTPGGEE